MNRFGKRVQKIEEYWFEVFGKSPAAHTCIAVSVACLATLYFVGLVFMVPASLIRAFR